MSSDVPRARRYLVMALDFTDIEDCKAWVRLALKLMTRERPKFRVPKCRPKMTREQVRRAKELRRAEMSVDDIGKRKGI